jgi:hypothetical protein
VARQVAAHFIKQAAAPQNASQDAMQLIREDSMFQLVNFVKTFARNEEGQDLLEYALLVASQGGAVHRNSSFRRPLEHVVFATREEQSPCSHR